MPQVEQVLASWTSCLVDAFSDRFLDLLLGAEQDGRVDVATDGDIRSQDLACLCHVHVPVHCDHVGSHVLLVFQVGRSSVGEVDDRHVGILVLHDLHGLHGSWLGVELEPFGAHLVGPGLEELHHLRAALDLVACVVADHDGQLVQEQRHGGVRACVVGHDELLRVQAVLGGLAFDGVGGQRERGADKADEGRVGILRLLRQSLKDLANERELLVEVHVAGVGQIVHISFAPDLGGDDRSHSRNHVEVDSKSRQRCENVREHDDAVHAVLSVALQAQLGRHRRCLRPLAERVFR
mmetsp:Transcript_372/g.1021  ORF Transcript_372/g.1021 Transcript_372/m.1021 type:complete len:294 (+) Transcript_372:172-1053(+)